MTSLLVPRPPSLQQRYVRYFREFAVYHLKSLAPPPYSFRFKLPDKEKMGDIPPSEQAEDTLPDLSVLWIEDNPSALSCYSCGLPFHNEAVIRTFRILPETSTDRQRPLQASKHLTIQNSQILFFNRHISCLSNSPTPYITISHVWDREVSDTQARGAHSPQPLPVRETVFSSALSIARALSSHASAPSSRDSHLASPVEIWHDYFSVPQWTPSIKHHILSAIPDVFQRAENTVVFMDDVSMDMVYSLYQGATSDERLAAITGICAAAWYKRVWTVLEFVRASRVRVMVQGFRVVEEVEDVFLSKLLEVWEAETAVHGAVQVEDKVRIGEALVPWNLGPLRDARALKRMDFASAWILLSRRGCRSIQDFWHALLGILRAEVPAGGLDLTGDPLGVCMAIVRACLVQKDLSPLLMTPTAEPYDRRGDWRRVTREGFNDVVTFGLGPQARAPDLGVVNSPDGQPMLELARMGKVWFVSNSPRHPDPMENFSTLFQIVLRFTGSDPEAFAYTMCSRLYFIPDWDQVPSILSSQPQRNEIQAILQRQYNAPADSPPDISTVRRLADLLCLTQRNPARPEATPALTFLRLHGGTIHLGWFGGLVGVTCRQCNESFLYRAAFYKPAAEIRGCVAYRIPGLDYPFSWRDGVGILVDGETKRIVGRMVWATPACACEVEKEREVVGVQVPDFYGVVTEEWVPS